MALNPAIIAAALLTLVPFITGAFFSESVSRHIYLWPLWLQRTAPVFVCLPYLLVTCSTGTFRWFWFSLYALVPIAAIVLLAQARRVDLGQHGTWRDFLVLSALGLAVDLRWMEPAWPPHLAIFNKILLLDLGIYGFTIIRQLDGVGFDLRLRLRDLAIGIREFAFFTPMAILLGLSLGFLHFHPHAPWLRQLPVAFFFTFFFIAVPEELFFRGWCQNLLERRLGRYPALALTAVLFGLSHFNKRAVHFNWRYVLLAAIAAIFYGRAWRKDRRVGASAITHTCVDSVWSIWLR